MRLIAIFPIFQHISAELVQLASPVQQDGTIRFPGFPNMCVFKRWNDYVVGHEVFSWPCDDINSPNQVKQAGVRNILIFLLNLPFSIKNLSTKNLLPQTA